MLTKTGGSILLAHNPPKCVNFACRFTVITIDLSDGTDVDVAANEAREIVSSTLRTLPDDIDDPSVTKSDSNADAISVVAQLEMTVDTAAASDMGLNGADVTQLVRAMVQGNVAVSVFADDVGVDVNVLPGPPIDDPSDIASLPIRLGSGACIPLSTVTALETVVSDAQIQRRGGALSVALQANLGEGVDLSTAMDRVLEIADEVLPEGMGIALTGEAATLDDTLGGMYAIFGVALIVVLLVLAAQFESFASAVVIMLTVPFGPAAALLAISITGGSLNYYSQIGLVMLIGVMAKNGILIVEFANQLREAGENIDSAIRNALRLRFRPVMMTMVSTVFGGPACRSSHASTCGVCPPRHHRDPAGSAPWRPAQADDGCR